MFHYFRFRIPHNLSKNMSATFGLNTVETYIAESSNYG